MKSRIFTDVEEIYVQLLDEGVECYRPARAIKIRDNVYRILKEQDAFNEEYDVWEFEPGSLVVVETLTSSTGKRTRMAVRKAEGETQ